MTHLEEFQQWLGDEQSSITYVFHGNWVEDLNSVEVATFNSLLHAAALMGCDYKLTADACGYVFNKPSSFFKNEPDERLDLNLGAGEVLVSVFRPRYRKLSDEELKLSDEIKAQAQKLGDLFDKVENRGRYVALAKTDLESAVMWAIKDLTK